jgi:hypothetical protein
MPELTHAEVLDDGAEAGHVVGEHQNVNPLQAA